MLEGIVRDSIAKQSTKQLRRDGYLIANIYGKGIENINAAFKVNDYIRYIKNKSSIAFDIKVGNDTHKVVVKDYQKHPVSGNLVHVDLQVALPGVRSRYLVPITVEGVPKGLKNKGLFTYHRRRVDVVSTIENLPENFHFDIAELDTGDNILVRDINLPEGVECFLDPRVPLIGVIKAK